MAGLEHRRGEVPTVPTLRSKKPRAKGALALTKKQRGFVKDYLDSGNASEAAKRHYQVSSDATARAIASENLTKPNIQSTIQEALEIQGLTNGHLAKKVAELVNAQKRFTYVRNGEVELIREEMDTQAVKAGLEFVFRLKERELRAGARQPSGDLSPEQIAELDAIIEANSQVY